MLVKIDAREGAVVESWSAEGVYMTEADFVPASDRVTAADEDAGLLLAVLYNATSDRSSLAVFDAKAFGGVPLGLYPLGGAIPFHAHGIVCLDGGRKCFPNP